MNITVKSSNGISLVPLNSTLLSDRKIFIEGTIESEMACDVVKQLMHLCMQDATKPIDIFINSTGGEINSGLMIYDAMRSCTAPVRVICMGKAYSMAAVLVASAPDGRYILPHSELMIHEPLLGNRVGGNSSSIKSISESLLDAKRKINEILSLHTGKTVEEIDEATSFDHYFSAEESIEFGLCDKIVSLRDFTGGN